MLSDDPPRYSPASTNVHRRVVPLRDGLLLAGFGGSCDAFRDGAIKWAGASSRSRHATYRGRYSLAIFRSSLRVQGIHSTMSRLAMESRSYSTRSRLVIIRCF